MSCRSSEGQRAYRVELSQNRDMYCRSSEGQRAYRVELSQNSVPDMYCRSSEMSCRSSEGQRAYRVELSQNRDMSCRSSEGQRAHRVELSKNRDMYCRSSEGQRAYRVELVQKMVDPWMHWARGRRTDRGNFQMLTLESLAGNQGRCNGPWLPPWPCDSPVVCFATAWKPPPQPCRSGNHAFTTWRPVLVEGNSMEEVLTRAALRNVTLQ